MKKGKIILSGIILDKLDEVKKVLEAEGILITEEVIEGEWAALVCHMKGE